MKNFLLNTVHRLKFRFPYVKYGKGFTQILTPKILVSINHQENDILGDFFIGADELTFGNVYSERK